MATYTYSIVKLTKDQFGVSRIGAVQDLPANALLPDIGEFQGAADLPDGVEFADGFDFDGKRVRVYREPA